MAEDPTQLEQETTITVPVGDAPDAPSISVQNKVCGPAPYVSVHLEKYCAGQVLESDGRRTLAQTRPYDYYAAAYFNQATAGNLDLQPVVDRVASRLGSDGPSQPGWSTAADDDEPEVTATALNEAASRLPDLIGEELSKLSVVIASSADPDTRKRDLKFRVEREGKKLVDVSTDDIETFDLSDLRNSFEGNGLEGGPMHPVSEHAPGARAVPGAEGGSADAADALGAEAIEQNGTGLRGLRARFEATSGEAGEQSNDTNNVNALVNGGFLIISVLQANLATALQANFGFNLANNNGNSGSP